MHEHLVGGGFVELQSQLRKMDYQGKPEQLSFELADRL